ncbi:MAG: PD-(D/E)XK nuclease family protein [Candidatus Thermoplasmatota archaeon]|nr:PD-(D/E)XK nuclease family protein [Candidatus Thermoplasmatota archaeon]
MPSLEVVPFGPLPAWVEEAMFRESVLVICATEGERRHHVRRMARDGGGVDASRITTLGRFLRHLRGDVGLPEAHADPALHLLALNEACQTLAESGAFLLPASTWSIGRTERLLRLHDRLAEEALEQAVWDEDPGLGPFAEAIAQVEAASGRLHPALVTRHVTEGLEKRDPDDPPFMLANVDGILLLPAPPDYGASVMALFAAVERFVDVHVLRTPGAMRTGFGGAILADVHPVDAATDVPAWLPQHEPAIIDARGWDVIDAHVDGVHRGALQRRSHGPMAAVDLALQHCAAGVEGPVMIVDADEGRRGAMVDELRGHGLTVSHRSSSPPSRAVSGVLRAAKAGSGPEAWSVEDLIELAGGASLGFDVAKTGALTHPSEPSWRPRGHVDLLRTVARTAHLRGGHGALRRWQRVLSTMHPNPHRGRLAHQRQQIEETYWWLECIAALWSPISDAEASDAPVGPISEANLPLPTPPTSLHAWFDLMLNAADWSMLRARTSDFDASVAGLHLLKERLDVGLTPDASGVKAVEAMEVMAADPPRAPAGAEGADVIVTSVDEALGRPSGLTVLSGLDDEAWSMRPADLPWCDRASRVSLGLFDGDLPIRRARYALAQIVAFSSSVIVFDTSAEEGAGPSPPLAEWLLHVRRTGRWTALNTARPAWFTTNEGEGVHGLWTFDGDGALQPRPGGFRNGQAGRAGRARRDARQRTGLDLDAGRDLHASVNRGALLAAAAPKVLQDRERRQPDLQALEIDEVLPWSDAARLQTTTRLNLRPTPSAVGKGRKVASVDGWPHLGLRINGNVVSVSMDPRPLAPPTLGDGALHTVIVAEGQGYEATAWSPSRLQGWVVCPRKAWLEQAFGVSGEDLGAEDVDRREQGDLVHRFEEASLRAFGTWSEEGWRTSDPSAFSPDDINAHWIEVIDAVFEQTPWLGRTDAVAMHRRRAAMGDAPAGATTPGPATTPQGELGRLLQADASLSGVAPLATEWAIVNDQGEVPTVHLSDDVEPQPLRCRIDRADEVILDEARRQAAIDAGLIGEEGPERLVILRDVKSVIGPRRGKEQERHLRALYDEVQLAAYVLAWEAARPNDRVIGVGISSVGAATWHHVELDTAWSEVLEGLELGQVTSHLWQTHPATLRDGTPSSSFRRWLEERALTMAKAVQAAAEGHVNPTPSKACSTCSVASACGVAHLGGGR